MKFLVSIISENPWKEIIPMFETETVGPCFILKLKWEEKEAGEGRGGGGVMLILALPVATPLQDK